MQVKAGIYRHYKGEYYVVVGEATHTETSARMVVYHPLRDPTILWVRPAVMFFDEVAPHNYPGNQLHRFVPATREEVLADAGE